MMKRVSLFILFSLSLHLLALQALPNVFRPARLPLIPVGLTRVADLYLEPVQLRAGGAQLPGLWESMPVEKIRDEVVITKLWEMTSSTDITPPLPRVRFFNPEKMTEQEQKDVLEASRFYAELQEILRKEGREGTRYDVPKPTVKDLRDTISHVPVEDVEARRIIISLRKVVEERLKRSTPLLETLELGIEGPAASRRVMYIPPPPKVTVSVEADVKLRFWVFPDGTVGKVFPLVKGDTQVDIAAINHIKKYRFNPLPKDSPQVEMWGEISVKSVLQ